MDRLANARDELIAALYAASAGIAPPSRPLERLAELTQSDKAFLARHDFSERRGEIIASLNVEPNFIDTYRDIYSRQNPWLARTSYFQAEGLVWRGAEILPLDQLRETEFYRLFCYGQAISHTAHLVLMVNGSEVLHVMLTRRPPADDYDAQALEICRLYTRHARDALRISEALAGARFVEESLATAIDELAAGVAVVEPSGRIIKANSAFENIMSGARSGNSVLHNRVTAYPWTSSRRTVEIKLPRALAEALASNPVPGFCVLPSADAEKRSVAVEIRPIQLRSGPNGIAREGYILMCRSLESEIELNEAALRSAYALTSAEARICAALVRGDNILELSERLSISPQTARTHLKRIYDKTSTNRQPELMRLLMTFAYRRPPQPVPPTRPTPVPSGAPLLSTKGFTFGK